MSERPQLPRWSESELNSDRQHSTERFIERRLDEGVETYLEIFREKERMVSELMDVSDDLLDLSGDVFVNDPNLVEPARHMAGPPISQDDLDTVARGSMTRRKNIDLDVAERGAEIILAVADPERLPWIDERRVPIEAERTRAIKSTASIWAIERSRTRRRVESSQEQEQLVVDRLKAEGWSEVEANRIDSTGQLDELPPGTFARRVYIEGSECDVAIRLADGRLLAMEGKVSNSEVNSIKRLIHEVGDKASRWRDVFGNDVIPAAFLSGVYKLKHLQEAQNDRGIVLVWDHDLEPLIRFIEEVESETGGDQ